MREPDEWHDEDPLIRALRAPGTPAELAREQEYAAAFRAAAAPRRLRLVGRAGVTAGAVAVTVAFSAGVAAAYSNVLPEPVQRLAHQVLGPVGVPAAAPRAADAPARGHRVPPVSSAPHRHRTTSASAAPTGSAAPGRTPTSAPQSVRPTAPPTSPIATPGTTLGPGVAGAAAPTSPAPTTGPAQPTPSTEPTTPTKPAVARPARVVMAISSRRVDPQGVVSVSGRVTSRSGAALGGRTVRLRARVAGGGWRLVASGSTGSDGTLSLQSPPIAVTTTFGLWAGKVSGRPARVVVVPTVLATYADGVVSATVVGGRSGDKVVLLRAGRQVAVARLAADGSVRFPVEQRARSVKLVVRVPQTAQHAAAADQVTVPPAS